MREKARFITKSPLAGGRVVELYNGRVVDVERGCYYPEGTRLFIKDRKILALKGEAEEGALKADFRMDLKGLTVIPGLFNTHCHLNIVMPAVVMRMKDISLVKKYSDRQVEKSLEDCLFHGVTTVREVLAERLDKNREYIRRIEEGTLQGPRIYNSVHIGPEGGTIAKRPGLFRKLMLGIFNEEKYKRDGVISLSPAASEQEMRDAVDRAIDEHGARFIKFYDQREKSGSYKPGALVFNVKQLAAAADQALKRGVKSTIHCLTRESFNRAVEAGVSSLAHFPYDVKLEKDDVRRFIDSGCYIEPTLTVGAYFTANRPGHKAYNHENMLKVEAIMERDYKKLASRYWIDELQESVISGYERLKAGKTKMFGLFDLDYIYRYYSGGISVGIENLRALIEAGGIDRIGAGSDAGASHTSIANMEFEYLLMRELLSFDAVQLLRAATINSAGAMGVEDILGSIEVGKLADLAIIEGDPINDSSCLGQPVRGLFKEGNLALAGPELELHPVVPGN